MVDIHYKKQDGSTTEGTKLQIELISNGLAMIIFNSATFPKAKLLLQTMHGVVTVLKEFFIANANNTQVV